MAEENGIHDALFYHLQGCLELEDGKFQDAIRLFGEALNLDHRLSESWYKMGLCHKRLKDYGKAITAFTKAVDLDSSDRNFFYERGICLQESGDQQNAIKDFSKAIALKEDDPLAHNLRGLCFRKIGAYEQALDDFKIALELVPRERTYQTNQAEVFYLQGCNSYQNEDFDKAIALFTQAIEYDGKFKGDWLERGKAYWKKEEFDLAIADLAKAIELDENHASAHNYRGLCWEGKNELIKALDDYCRAAELDPSEKVYLQNKAIIFNKLGKDAMNDEHYILAKTFFSEAIKNYPEYASPYHNRGICENKLEEVEKAVEDFTRAIERAPENVAFLLSRARLLEDQICLGGLFRSPREAYERALIDIERMIELQPEKILYYALRGNVHFNFYCPDLDQALKDYSFVIEKAPGYPDSYIARGNVFSALGDHESALVDFEKYLELEPKNTRALLKIAQTWAKLNDFGKSLDTLLRAERLSQAENIISEANDIGERKEDTGASKLRFLIATNDTGMDESWKTVISERFGEKYTIEFICTGMMEEIMLLAYRQKYDVFIPLINNLHMGLGDKTEIVIRFLAFIKSLHQAPIVGLYLYPREVAYAIRCHRAGIDWVKQGHFCNDIYSEVLDNVEKALRGESITPANEDPDTVESCIQYGKMWEDEWNRIGSAYEPAIEEYTRGFIYAEGNEPAMAQLYFLRGSAWLRKAEDDAQSAQKYASDESSDDEGIKNETILARYQEDMDEAYQKAIADLTKSLELKADHHCYLRRGLSYMGRGMLHEAMTDMQQIPVGSKMFDKASFWLREMKQAVQ